MDFSIRGTPTPRSGQRPFSGRPPSAKPQSTRNPITGEEGPVRPQSRSETQPRPQSRPKGIPDLDLKYLKENEDYVYKPIELYDYPLHSPNSARTDVSWGTSVASVRSNRSSRQQNGDQGYVPDLQLSSRDQYSSRGKPVTPKPKQPSAWDKAPVPDNVPPPSSRHQQMYKQYEDEKKQSYQSHTQKGFTDEEIEQVVEEVKQQHADLHPDNTEDVIGTSWTKRPTLTSNQLLKRMDAEDMLEHNKKETLIETVMVDQLSRAVISDPEQNVRSAAAQEIRRARGSNRSLHDSKVRTTSTATENLLSKRVRFSARVVTRNGHDAIRELTGFFFSVDNTMTIYEFRQFGKTAKALPFLVRGSYSHLSGPRAGEPYTLIDICQGSDVVVPSKGQTSLPETLKRVPEVTFKITEVEEEEKKNLLLHGISAVERDEAYIRLHIPNKQEFTEKKILKALQANVQKKLRKRAIRSITGLGRYYRKVDSSGNGSLYRYELEKALFDFRIDIPPDALDTLFEILDEDEKGELDYSVYMRAVIGEMDEVKKSFMRKAFRKIDTGKKGYLTLSDIKKFFNTTFTARTGARAEAETGPLQAFLDAVLSSPKQEDVSYAEFEEYYEGLSLSVDEEDFFSILKNTWSL